MPAPLSGVYSPVITPFGPDLAPDGVRLARFCRWLLAQGCGLAVFGTNSEANSLSLAERRRLLDALADADVDASRMVPGTGACALPDAIELTRHAVDQGCAGVLMLPPFYYKEVSDDGLFAYYAGVIDALASDRLRILLYHIPQVSGVGLSIALVRRLVERFPGTVAGIKDSSGNWENTRQLLEIRNLAVFPGSETFLPQALPLGAAGCISATANINPGGIARYIERWQSPEGKSLGEAMTAVRKTVQRYDMIPALKYVVASASDDQGWRQVRPPLVPLPRASGEALEGELRQLGFAPSGLREAMA